MIALSVIILITGVNMKTKQWVAIGIIGDSDGPTSVFIASHSPILLGIPDAQILSFDEGVIHECEYEDADSYQVTEMFINNREYLLVWIKHRIFKWLCFLEYTWINS